MGEMNIGQFSDFETAAAPAETLGGDFGRNLQVNNHIGRRQEVAQGGI